jgi:hypothetical protein
MVGCLSFIQMTVLGLLGDEKLPFRFRIFPNGIFLPMGGVLGARIAVKHRNAT